MKMAEKTQAWRVARIDEVAFAFNCAVVAFGSFVLLALLALVFQPWWMGGYGMMNVMGGMMGFGGVTGAYSMFPAAGFGGAAFLWFYGTVWVFLVTLVLAGLYNIAARVTGGVKIDFKTEKK